MPAPKTKLRRSYGTHVTSVDVDIDVAEVIADLEDDEIRNECAIRGIKTDSDAAGAAADSGETWRDFAEELRNVGSDRIHLEVLIVRMLAMAGVPRMTIPAKV